MRARQLGGLIVTAALGGCVTGGASPTGMIEQVSPDLIAGILDTYHVDHRVSVGDDGNPMIVVASGPEIPAAQMFVRFHDCDAARACESLTLWSWYADTGEADSDAINRWNREARSTRLAGPPAWLPPRDPAPSADVRPRCCHFAVKQRERSALRPVGRDHWPLQCRGQPADLAIREHPHRPAVERPGLLALGALARRVE